MNNAHLMDFYLGWSIEVIADNDRFAIVCYSPCRRRIQDSASYESEFIAMTAAKRAIDWCTACHTLSRALRELYETERIDFEEWQPLHQSLMAMLETAQA
jgi:hypothetical protein